MIYHIDKPHSVRPSKVNTHYVIVKLTVRPYEGETKTTIIAFPVCKWESAKTLGYFIEDEGSVEEWNG